MPGTMRTPLPRRMFNSLDQRLDRRVLAWAGSVLVSVKRGSLCRVRHEDGDWIHHYRTGVVVNTTLGGPSADMEDRATSDTFLFDYRPGPGDTVVDVGAGVGSEVRLLSRLVGPTGRVVSIEAHPRVFRCLRQTVVRNRLTNVSLVQCAVVGEAGVVHLEDDLTGHWSNGLTADPTHAVAVNGRTLTEILASLAVDRVDLLKMNIEGAELAVLAGSLDALATVAHIAVSCHDFKADRVGGDWQRTFEPVGALLRDAGYTVRSRSDDSRPWIRDYLYASR